MRFFNPIFLVVVILSVSCRKDELNIPLAYDIILVAGQSNTHFGYGIDSDLDQSDDKIQQLGRFKNDYEIILAVEPLDHHTKKDSCIGFSMIFAKYYEQEYLEQERKILIIPCGVAGTSYMEHDWNLGDFYYSDAVNRTKYVMENYPDSKLVTILWHQGESDLGNENYQSDLDRMISQMRQDVLSSEIPFILGGMVPYWVNQNDTLIEMQAIISKTSQREDRCGYADPNQPFVIDKFNNNENQIHYDAIGQRELGKRYFNAFKKMN